MMTLPPQITRFRLGIYQSDYGQPMSLMRCLGPFSQMAREDPRLELVFPLVKPEGADLGWTWLSRCDAIWYQHPATDLDLSVLWLARIMGVPVWTEFVDDVFSVLPTNPHYQHVKNKRAVRENVTQAIAWSDMVSAVSEICRAQYPQPERISVIPEACLWPPWQTPRRRCVSWRGLASHEGDVETILRPLCAVARDFPEWEWALLGCPTEEFVAQLSEAAGPRTDGSARVKVAPYFSTPFHALQAWGGCAPYLHLVPLAENAFNQSKSHLAWLEASAIGAAVLVPENFPTWQQPGVIPYYAGALVGNGKLDFAATLRRELTNYPSNGKLHPNVLTARATVYPDRTLPAINQLRWAVLRKLAAGQSRKPLEVGPESVYIIQNHTEPGSQAGQDEFVLRLLGTAPAGTFLDIGSGDPIKGNNTWRLEQAGWNGLRVESAPDSAAETQAARKSELWIGDARQRDWTAQADVDYLSLDVDEATPATLDRLLAAGMRFRVATIEHDSYRFGPGPRDHMRAALQAAGYTLLCADVSLNHEHMPFEDWFVNLQDVPPEFALRYRCDGKSWQEILASGKPTELTA